MADTGPAVETHGLRKVYGSKVAVADLSLVVERGESFAFLGPNGAGKTTSMKMLLGLSQPTAGDGTILGKSIGDPRCRQRIGFLPEHFSFPDWLRADEFLDVHGRLFGLSVSTRRRRIAELLDQVGLSAAASQRLGTYSKGMLQRVGLAQALINDPEIVFLDEPTSGLDPLGRRMVRDVIRRLRDRDVTVFLNSHLLGEVEATCTRAAFIAAGAVRSVADLGEQQGSVARLDLTVGTITDDLVSGLKRWGVPVDVDRDRGTLSMQVASRATLPEIASWLVTNGVDLYRFAPQQVSLEDLFVRIMEDQAPCGDC